VGTVAKSSARPDILAAKAGLGTFGVGRELKRLPELLRPDETVEALSTGYYENGKDNGLVALTGSRLLYLRHGLFSQWTREFALDTISELEWTPGRLAGTLTVTCEEERATITGMAKISGQELVDALHARLSAGDPAGPAGPGGTAEREITGRLATLDRLREAGTITETEHRRRRERILDGI
jgi:hypothetical protein